MSNEYMVTVFNTVTARYEEIAVSKEIYNIAVESGGSARTTISTAQVKSPFAR